MYSYKIPAGRQRFEITIKRSRFITTVCEAIGRDAAMTRIDSVRQEFADANHHCWAYMAGAPGDVFAIDKSDDGEPKGTAGKPMLNVLMHSGVGHAVVVVSRYFGGIKLGSGGLVRAYTHSVSEALQQLKTTDFTPTERREISLPYEFHKQLEYRLAALGIAVAEREFAERICLRVDISPRQLDELEHLLTEFGRGRILVHAPHNT